jgi:ankyrin repeat protein
MLTAITSRLPSRNKQPIQIPNVGDTGIIQITVHDFSSVSPTNPLYQAIGDEDAQQVTKLIETGIDVNQVDPESGTPLQAAISLGSNEMADLLLQYGANPLIGDSATNALHSATVHRNVFVLTLVLINARSRIDLSSREDLDSYMNIINRALYIASLQCYNDILLALVNAGADPLVKLDNNQNTLEAALSL